MANIPFRHSVEPLLQIPNNRLHATGALSNSIDEIADEFYLPSIIFSSLKPETEFSQDCANLQAWAEADYDTRLLHRRFSFPLLKSLVDAGDPSAKSVIGQEIVARLKSGYFPVIAFLVANGFIKFLSGRDLQDLPTVVLAYLAWKQAITLTSNQNDQLLRDPNVLASGGRLYGVVLNKTLDLSGGHLTDLSILKNIDPATLNSLRAINLSHNNFKMMPTEFDNCKSLQKFDLSGNSLTSISPGFCSHSSLKHLKLAFNSLTSLPPEIGNLSSLQILMLRKNRLDALPREMGRLRSLKELDLADNQVTVFPPGLGVLSSLLVLNFIGNKLETVPPEIGNLISLQTLWLGANSLTSLPPEIGKLKALRLLDVAVNRLTSLPPEIGHLTSLERLYLNHNQINKIPAEIGKLQNLFELNLSQNKINKLPAEVGRLQNLSELDLALNKNLSSLDELRPLHKLKTLNIRLYAIDALPEWLLELQSLTKIEVEKNLVDDPVAAALRSHNVQVG